MNERNPEEAAGPTSQLQAKDRIQLLRNGLFNYAPNLLGSIVNFALVALMLQALGVEGYGLWLGALAVCGLVGELDLGLGLIVTRRVAAISKSKDFSSVHSLVSTIGTAYLFIGFVGGLLVSLAGLALSSHFHLSPASQSLAPALFVLCGVGFMAEQMASYARAVLLGLQRFEVTNCVVVAILLARTCGIALILLTGKGLIALACWHAIGAILGALVTLLVVHRIEPQLRFRLGHFKWPVVRAQLPMGLQNQLTVIACKAIWEPAPILIGLFLGASQIVPFSVGLKFPIALAQMTWSMAAVLFPTISADSRNSARTRETLEAGMHWVLLVTLPACIGLWMLAPTLLTAWLKDVPADSIAITRLATTAVLADAIGVCALYVLWGLGSMRATLVALGAVAVANLILTVPLLLVWGVLGAAWALLFALTSGALALLYVAGQACGGNIIAMIGRALRGLIVPSLACAAGVFGVLSWYESSPWNQVLLATFVGGAAYAGCVYAVKRRRGCASKLLCVRP